MEAKIHIQTDASPRYYMPWSVPYALRDKVDAALGKLEESGVIERVEHSDWSAPIAPILESDGSIHICGNYKLTVNQVIKRDTFPLPRIEDLFAALEGGETFSKLDLAQAHLHIPLDEASKSMVAINTSRGLFRYN